MRDSNANQYDVVLNPTYPLQENRPELPASSAIPNQNMPLPPTKRSHRRLWIILGSIGCLLLIAGGGVSYLLLSSPQNPAAGTLDKYCNALQTGDYQTAIDQTALLQDLNEQSLANFYSAHPVASCTVTSFEPSKSESGAIIPNSLYVLLTITYRSGQQETDKLFMEEQSSNKWKIDLILFPPGNCTRIEGCS